MIVEFIKEFAGKGKGDRADYAGPTARDLINRKLAKKVSAKSEAKAKAADKE